MNRTTPNLEHVLHALADKQRRDILAVLRTGPSAVGALANQLGMSQQTTSHHLRVLRDARLATVTKQGTRHIYALETEGLASVRAYLDEFWPTKLQALKQAIENGDES